MSEPRDPWQAALTLLTRRSYTRAELAERLKRKGHQQAAIESVLKRLEEYRLVDDEHYAVSYVHSHGRRKGLLALRFELGRKGVAEGHIARALADVDEESQLKTAIGLLEAGSWRFRRGEPRTRRARAFAYLARRGFPASISAEAVELTAAEWHEEDAS